MRQPALLGQLGGADSALNHCVHGDVARVARLGGLGVLIHQLGEQLLVERAPVHADAHRFAVGDGHFDNLAEVGVVVLGTHVAGVDAVLGERFGARGILGEQEMAVVVEVADDGDVHLGDDLGDGGRRGVVVDRDAYQLGARLVQRPHLRRRPRDVRGVGVRHGLDDDRVSGAHLHAADVHRHSAPARGTHGRSNLIEAASPG